MATVKCILGLLAQLAVSAWAEARAVRGASGDDNSDAEGDPTVTEQLEKANENLRPDRDGIQIIGDIAVSRLPNLRNADPCVHRGFMWPKSHDGKVYVPYVIANTSSKLKNDASLSLPSVPERVRYSAFDPHDASLTRQEHNFRKINTPYDYNSIVHYGRLAFSKDNYHPTIAAVPDASAVFGTARQRSQNDLDRINLLYCAN
ncbi:putative high choriolytic enzyme 1-like [Scophthalmus maximus]|uniref:Putative high choriolytic enzyme 1-like n=1 Tax=Scophthalmus maximus TaxID=52904 RepID=A0A2U9BUC7_SCOMX|nr:putative high choriolytic enzyme 1-like [Scophthalmus maximus]